MLFLSEKKRRQEAGLENTDGKRERREGGMDEQGRRREHSRRGAAGLVFALLGCVGVKLQQLILQVQLVVQLGHLQVT